MGIRYGSFALLHITNLQPPSYSVLCAMVSSDYKRTFWRSCKLFNFNNFCFIISQDIVMRMLPEEAPSIPAETSTINDSVLGLADTAQTQSGSSTANINSSISGQGGGQSNGLSNGQGKNFKRPVNDRVPQLRAAATKVGLKMLPLQTEIAWERKGVNFTMILAGCRGTGKSTFLDTLIGESMEENSRPFINGQVRSRRFYLVENKFDMNLTVVDMPDFGSKIDNHYTWLPIVKYIEYQFRLYLVQEEQPVRDKIKDNRVHVCVYFISPTNTQLSTLDVESMKEIAKRVSLIPVIARSDTLNKEELGNFKAIINKTLRDENIEICKYLTESHVIDKLLAHLPYAIIGSNTLYKNTEGQLVRARKYGWGMVEVENPDHCDFVHIRDLLMSENMLDLITAMEKHYDFFRSDFLRSRIRGQRKTADETDLAATNEDGMNSYKLYSLLLSRESQIHLEKYSGEEEALQKEVRTRLESFRLTEEKRLREWKKRIADVQVTQNADLEVYIGKVRELEKQILMAHPGENDNIKDIAERASISARSKIITDQDSVVTPSITAV